MALKLPKDLFEKLPWLNTMDRFQRTRNNLSESVLSPGQTENFIMKTLELLANGGNSVGGGGDSTPDGTSDVAKALGLYTLITKYTTAELQSKLTKGAVTPVYSLRGYPGPNHVSFFLGLAFWLTESVPIFIIGLGIDTSTGRYDGIHIGQQMSDGSCTVNDSFEWIKIPFTTN